MNINNFTQDSPWNDSEFFEPFPYKSPDDYLPKEDTNLFHSSFFLCEDNHNYYLEMYDNFLNPFKNEISLDLDDRDFLESSPDVCLSPPLCVTSLVPYSEKPKVTKSHKTTRRKEQNRLAAQKYRNKLKYEKRSLYERFGQIKSEIEDLQRTYFSVLEDIDFFSNEINRIKLSK